MLGETRYVGSSVLRNEDQRLLNGNGNFLDDIKISGCQYIHFVRSNIAHGIVKSIDISEAEKVAHITKIYTEEKHTRIGIAFIHLDSANSILAIAPRD